MKADLLIVWGWEFDVPYLEKLRVACESRGVSTYLVGADGLKRLPEQLSTKALEARCVIDRAWDWGDEYEVHVEAVNAHVPVKLNDYALVRRTWNKPTMHFELIARGLHAAHMAILPSFDAQPTLKPVDLSVLGERFSVKAAHSGGSGVLTPARSWDEVLEKRKEWSWDETIVQSWVEPQTLGDRRAWFRCFYACGAVFTCWADDQTHVQEPVSPADERRFRLDRLRGMTAQIAGICGLNVFSTEIALDQHHVWQVVDYVNDPCDFRLKSKVVNGVPDEVVDGIAQRIAAWVARAKR